MTTTPAIALTALRTRMTRVFPAQIRAAVEPLTDEQLWWRPNESSNSIGNLVVHLAGSLRYYVGNNLGGIPFVRDRAAEFAERGPIPKAALMATLQEMVSCLEQTFLGLTPDRLSDPSPEPSMHEAVIEDLLNAAMHLSTHTGQIVWIAKMLVEGSVRETWIRSHRREGAWKPA